LLQEALKLKEKHAVNSNWNPTSSQKDNVVGDRTFRIFVFGHLPRQRSEAYS
jgi:hypothetical protein